MKPARHVSVTAVLRDWMGRICLGLAALVLASCSGVDGSELDVAIIARPDDLFETGMVRSDAAKLVRAATVEGLVAFDAQGRVVSALADRWIVTDDGQSYIFRLREGNWGNGDPITAESARSSLRSALRALRDTPMQLDLSGIDEVRVMASRVIEIRLTRPMPFLLQLLAQPELGLYHDKEGAGPMAVTRSEGFVVLDALDPALLGLPEIDDWQERTRPVRLSAMSGPDAVDAFNAGEADLVLGGRIQDFPLTRSVGILRGTIQLDPVIGLFGLKVMNDGGFLADPANREALSMAIDRDSVVSPFGVGGWSPTTRIVAPSLEGDLNTIGERWSEQSIAERRAVAAARVMAWGAAENAEAAADEDSGTNAQAGVQRIALRVWLPSGEGSDQLFTRLSADVASIGVSLERADEPEEADLALIDEVARYPRASWFLNRLSCQARWGLCSAEADARVAEAASAEVPAERSRLLTEAEMELTSANIFIPLGPPIRWSLVRGSVDGFEPNNWGWHPLMPLSWVPR